MDSTYNIVLSTSESTVVTEYVPEKKRSDAYQSEAALEDAFIKMLSEQGYPQGTLAVTSKQTAGKGRRGRTWISPPDVNV